MGPGVTVTQKGVPKGRGLARFLQRSGLKAGASWRLAWLERGCSLRESDSSFAVPVATVLEPSEGHIHPRSRAFAAETRGQGARHGKALPPQSSGELSGAQSQALLIFVLVVLSPVGLPIRPESVICLSPCKLSYIVW